MSRALHTLRLGLLFGLMLALLPWGAFARAYPAPMTVSAGTEAAASADDATVAPTRHCRGPALLGAPCGPDLALLPLPNPPAPHATVAVLLRDAPLLAKGRVAIGLKDPPILR